MCLGNFSAWLYDFRRAKLGHRTICSLEEPMTPSLLSLSILVTYCAGVLAGSNASGYVGNSGKWTPKFAATAWKATRRGSDTSGAHLFFTGFHGCNGIQFATLADSHSNSHHGRMIVEGGISSTSASQSNRGGSNAQSQGGRDQTGTSQAQENTFTIEVEGDTGNDEASQNTSSYVKTDPKDKTSGIQTLGASSSTSTTTSNVNSNSNHNSQTSFWNLGYCFGNSGHGSWGINAAAAFAVTSVGGSNDLADMRLFYWTTSGRGKTPVLKDAYYSRGGHGKRGPNAAGRWKVGKLSKKVSRANVGSLAATSWTKDGKVGRTVFYVQGGYLRELTLDESDGGHGGWNDEERDGVELHFTPGEMSAVSWFDGHGILHKRVYIRNTSTNQVVEYAWSNDNPYTTWNNLYATSSLENGAASSAASVQVSRSGKPMIYLWAIGTQGGNVMEDGQKHGKDAKPGTQMAAASAKGGSSFVFWLNSAGRLVQSSVDAEGNWHEDLLVKVGKGH